MNTKPKPNMHFSVLPAKEAPYLIDLFEGANICAIGRIWSRLQVANGEAPISYANAMTMLRTMRDIKIFSIAPLVIECSLTQDELNKRLNMLKDDEHYICTLLAEQDEFCTEDNIERIRKKLNTGLSDAALEVFNQMEKNALADPFSSPIPIGGVDA